MSEAFITIQGNPNSRKLYDPSGYTLFAPCGTKTYRTLYDAVLFGTRKGYTMHYTRPVKSNEVSEKAAARRFNDAVVRAQAAKNAPVGD